MITISVKTETGGLEKIIANCDNLTPEIIEENTKEAEGYAKIFAPVDTGFLRNSLSGFMVERFTGRVQSDANYDIYQELGTYKMAAQPFLAPAIEQIAGKFLSPNTWRPLIE